MSWQHAAWQRSAESGETIELLHSSESQEEGHASHVAGALVPVSTNSTSSTKPLRRRRGRPEGTYGSHEWRRERARLDEIVEIESSQSDGEHQQNFIPSRPEYLQVQGDPGFSDALVHCSSQFQCLALALAKVLRFVFNPNLSIDSIVSL